MRRFVIKGDFRNIRRRRADFLVSNKDLLFSIDEKPFPFVNQKMFGLELIGTELWKDLFMFPVICLLVRDLFELEIRSIRINSTDHKIPFVLKEKPTRKEVKELISTIDCISDETIYKLCYSYDENYIPHCLDEIAEKFKIDFNRENLLSMVDRIKDLLPEKDKQKRSHKLVKPLTSPKKIRRNNTRKG